VRPAITVTMLYDLEDIEIVCIFYHYVGVDFDVQCRKAVYSLEAAMASSLCGHLSFTVSVSAAALVQRWPHESIPCHFPVTNY